MTRRFFDDGATFERGIVVARLATVGFGLGLGLAGGMLEAEECFLSFLLRRLFAFPLMTSPQLPSVELGRRFHHKGQSRHLGVCQKSTDTGSCEIPARRRPRGGKVAS